MQRIDPVTRRVLLSQDEVDEIFTYLKNQHATLSMGNAIGDSRKQSIIWRGGEIGHRSRSQGNPNAVDTYMDLELYQQWQRDLMDAAAEEGTIEDLTLAKLREIRDSAGLVSASDPLGQTLTTLIEYFEALID